MFYFHHTDCDCNCVAGFNIICSAIAVILDQRSRLRGNIFIRALKVTLKLTIPFATRFTVTSIDFDPRLSVTFVR